MTAPELHARLTAASAALGDYRNWAAGGAISGDWQSWAQRVAVELASVCTALRGALAMLADADAVLDDQDTSGLIGTGGLSISPADATTVLGALADAVSLLRHQADQFCPDCEETADDLCGEHLADLEAADRYASLADRLGGHQ